MKKTNKVLVSTLSFLAVGSLAAASSLVTSDFEDETVGESTTDSSLDVQYWTAVNELIDLGVSEIAGCTTVDQSDYTQLRLYSNFASIDFATYRQDNDLTNYPSAFTPFSTRVDVLSDGLTSSNVLALRINSASALPTSATVAADASESAIRNQSYNADDGFVLHGPAVYSDPFVASAGLDLSFDWRAVPGGDDYKAYAYLLNVDDCSQQLLIDETGNSVTWNSETVTVAASGTYRFVFVAGTFDQSFGSLAGGALSIDNVQLPTFTTAAGGSFAGSIVSGVGSPSSFSFTPEPGDQAVSMYGARFESVTKAYVGDQEVDFVVVSDQEISVSIPSGLSPGFYDIRLEGSLGAMTRIQALQISESFSESSVYGDPKVWTVRISDEQAKLYAKFPEVGTQIRFGHQTGGAGSYETVFVKTIESETDSSLITNAFGKYVVRTIDLDEGINRIRISIDGEREVQVRYNR